MYKQLIPDTDLEMWIELNEEELTCIFAESGADRELDFDREKEELEIWEKDIRNFYEDE